MKTKPNIEFRPAYPYAAIRMQVGIPFGTVLQEAWGKVHTWLAGQGIVPGVAIIRYLTTDMSAKLDLDVGFTIPSLIPAGDGVITDALPAGQYATLMHTGPYSDDGVYKANVAIVEWAKENAVKWDVSNLDGVEWWKSRVEWYLSDPDTDPDPEKYQTELTFMVDADE